MRTRKPLVASLTLLLLFVTGLAAEKDADWKQGTLVSIEMMTFPVTPKRVAHRYRCVVSDGTLLYTLEYEKPIKTAAHDPIKLKIKKDQLTLLDSDGRERATRIETRERVAQ
jgi:hypothetical protein